MRRCALALSLCLLAGCARPAPRPNATTASAAKRYAISGQILVVNTASKCGLTPQYEALQAIHEEYSDRGLVVIGFPCDQFAHQEPGDDAKVKDVTRGLQAIVDACRKKAPAATIVRVVPRSIPRILDIEVISF